MANITETAQWEAAIREIATTDPVVGGPTGPANIQAQQLANRTAYLKDQITQLLANGGGGGGGTVPNATELVAGILAIATQAETNAGAIDNKAVTPLKLANATSTSIATHEQAADPHPQYLTQPEADALYPQLDANGNVIQPAGLGVNQTWQDVTASRAVNTTYTNTTGRPILLSLFSTNDSSTRTIELSVDGVVISRTTHGNYYHNAQIAATVIVPSGSTYAASYAENLLKWMELR